MKTIFKYIFSVALGSIMLTSCDLDTIPTTYVDAGSVFGKTGDAEKVLDRKSTRLNSSHSDRSRMPSSA